MSAGAWGASPLVGLARYARTCTCGPLPISPPSRPACEIHTAEVRAESLAVTARLAGEEKTADKEIRDLYRDMHAAREDRAQHEAAGNDESADDSHREVGGLWLEIQEAIRKYEARFGEDWSAES